MIIITLFMHNYVILIKGTYYAGVQALELFG